MNSSEHPWFSVGEEVILQNITYPEYNGEYYIERVVYEDDIIECRITNQTFRIYGIGYLLNTPLLNKIDMRGLEVVWDKISLRKKHKPSDESFGELMNNLKSVTA